MRNSILTSAAAIALIMFSAPAFAQMSQNMPGMSMGGMSNDSVPAPATRGTADQTLPANDANESMPMKGMDMSKMVAGNGKRGCGMHMTRTSMSMGSKNHRCMMHMTRASMSVDKSNAPARSNLELRHFQMTHPGGTGSR